MSPLYFYYGPSGSYGNTTQVAERFQVPAGQTQITGFYVGSVDYITYQTVYALVPDCGGADTSEQAPLFTTTNQYNTPLATPIPVTPGNYYCVVAQVSNVGDSAYAYAGTSGPGNGYEFDGSWHHLNVGGPFTDIQFTVTFPDPTTTTVVSSAPTSTYGSAVTLTATVTPTDGLTPTGAVFFQEAQQTVTLVANTDGTASATLTSYALPAGTITAAYVPAAGEVHDSSTGTTTETLTPVATAVALTASQTPIDLNAGSTILTAIVTSSIDPTTGLVSAPAAGAVDFKLIAPDGTTVLEDFGSYTIDGYGVALAGVAAFDATVGSYVASYTGSGDEDFAPSVSAPLALPASTTGDASASLRYHDDYGNDFGGGNYGDYTLALGAPNPVLTGSDLVTGDVPSTPPAFADSLGALACSTAPSFSLDGNGLQVATCATSLPAGAQTISFTFDGADGNPAVANLTTTVLRGTSTVAFTSPDPNASSNEFTLGDAYPLVASVTGDAGPAPGGFVRFTAYSYNNSKTYTIGVAPVVNGTATLSPTYEFALDAGYYVLYANYLGDVNYAPATNQNYEQVLADSYKSATLSLTDGLAATGTTAPTVQAGATVTFTATIANTVPGVTPKGAILFTIADANGNTVAQETANLNSAGVATFPYTFAASGSFQITADYPGDNNYTGSTYNNAADPTVSVTVASNATAIASVTGTVAGAGTLLDTDTLTAKVTLPTGAAAPLTGAVYFYVHGSSYDTSNPGAGVLCSTNTFAAATGGGFNASCSPSVLLSGGDNYIDAYYSGDEANAAASSTTSGKLTLLKIASGTTGGTVTPTTVVYGSSIHVTGTVAYAGTADSGSNGLTPPTPTGFVTFSIGGTQIGPQVSVADFEDGVDLISVPVGTNEQITVTYGGDANYSSSTATLSTPVTVTAVATTTTLFSSSNPAGFGSGLVITAVVAPTTGQAVPSGTAQLFDGTTMIATTTVANGVGQFHVSTLAVGTHSLTAQYAANGNFVASTSAAISQVIALGVPTLSVTASPTLATFGKAITFTGTVTVASGTPTGSITLTEGTATVATITLASGTGTTTLSSLSVGSHTLTASYSGDASFGTVTGSVIVVVVQATTTVTLTSSVNPTTPGSSITLTAAVTSNGGTADGTVQLFDGATPVGTATALASGSATFTISAITAGAHAYRAVYAGNASYAGALSPLLVENVSATSTTTSSSDGGTTTTTKKSGGGCDMAGGSASGAFAALFLLLGVALLRRRASLQP